MCRHRWHDPLCVGRHSIVVVGFRLIAFHPEFGLLYHLHVSQDWQDQKLYLRVNDGVSILGFFAGSLTLAVGLLMMALRQQS